MKPHQPNISEIFEAVTPIQRAVQEAAREAVLFNKRIGNPVSSRVNGKVVLIPPEEIIVPDPKQDEPNK